MAIAYRPTSSPDLRGTDAPTESWGTVLDIYQISDEITTKEESEDTLSLKLFQWNGKRPTGFSGSILSSERSNDVISEEVADIIGFDNITLVIEILNSRSALIKKLTGLLSRPKYLDRTAHGQLEDLAPEEARKRMERNFRENASRPLFSVPAGAAVEALPHVYTSSSIVQGTVRQMHEEFEEVILPPAKSVPPRLNERLIPVPELDVLAKGCFPGYSTLNRIQSIVYPTAYHSNENLLICAPTGAGKTDVAMLTILRVLNQHRLKYATNLPIHATIDRDSFKIIYVAPMKALASEIVRKLGKRLQWLSIKVQELTGDMQMTKVEIAQTQIIVTTPEKWDVVTRKPTGEGELAASLKLLIIDEVHLLNEERGAVIETIVARTLRQVESSQSMIRIVGLSATLPNYLDVAEFLWWVLSCVGLCLATDVTSSASKLKGLFYFDSSFRPIPLEQHFLGIKGKPGSDKSKKNLDRVTFQKVSELVAQGHQVMVFVHARKETVKTALGLMESSVLEGNIDDFSCETHPQWSIFRRNIGESRNKEMKQLFDRGFGIHHAGMLRSDRNMMERMFEARAIKVLCCTATLAWGVNLPAHAVIIKGTQVYDSSKGAFVDLSVLDVLQVFGRAGRPGLETSGEGYICTTEDKLAHYLDAILSQNPIESQFQKGMVDSLNAEISLGTVANARDAVQWLGYTYLFVRMRKNPFIYGISRDATSDDPQLGSKRHELVSAAAQKLADARMIVYNKQSGAFTITDLGRIAAKYYIRYTSIEIFNEKFRPVMTEADVLAMLSMSTEFDQIQVRESEVKELEQLMERVPCDVKDGTDTSQGKVNILLQGFISREIIEDFALVSDTAYAAQNGGRIVRALLEIAISRKWATVTAVLMALSKAIEKRLWPFDQPLKQFDLKAEIIYGLQEWADDWSVAQLASIEAQELGKLIRLNERHGQALLNAANQFPSLEISCHLRPLGHDILKIAVQIKRLFNWSTKTHGNAETFWVWVEDREGLAILQLAHITFRPTTQVVNTDFIIPIPDGRLHSVTIRWVSDRWIGAEDEKIVSLDTLIMPRPPDHYTLILNIPFLPITVVNNSTVQNIFNRVISDLNSIQTQVFWGVVNTVRHSLCCAPAGSGKSLIAQILTWTTILKSGQLWVLAIAPRRSVATEMVAELRMAAENTNISIEFSRDSNTLSRPRTKTIRVVTAAHLLHIFSTRHPGTSVAGLGLVVCENLEQLDACYELSISLLRHATQTHPTRFVGFSDSLNDATDLADWLDVDPGGLYNFLPRDRDQALTVSAHTFTIPQSAALFKAMVKPAHSVIRTLPIEESAIIFVPSRGQCRAIAMDLITQCALDMETETGYLPQTMPTALLEDYLARIRDKSLIDFVSKGVGFFHEGIQKEDRLLMLKMYADGIVRVLIVPRDSCWTVPVRAAAVVIMGTQYVYIEADGADRQLRDYPLTEIVRMQGRAIRHSKPGSFHLFCQAEAKDTLIRFLNGGLPLESQLLHTPDLSSWYKAQRKIAANLTKQDLMDLLSFTFLARRVASNPVFYDYSTKDKNKNLSDVVEKIVDGLQSLEEDTQD
ncbi:Sec63 Brl domain-containing protein [Infundibulicybe gibba]|nr:Sec63 Brl domain-containing protein [Infundibulicybe gibba]